MTSLTGRGDWFKSSRAHPKVKKAQPEQGFRDFDDSDLGRTLELQELNSVKPHFLWSSLSLGQSTDRY